MLLNSIALKISLGRGLPVSLQQLSALFGLILLSPLLVLVALLIKLESNGPVIFHQVRIGEHGRRFKFYKFRSMYLPTDPRFVSTNDLVSDRDGVCKKFKRDPRITRIGRFIRKLSIDELPQLFNVLKGDMLLIGPRPALEEEVNAYSKRSMNRLNIKPGITGLWQVSGRADTTFEQQVALDIQYIRNKSLLNDLIILFSTVPAVLSGKGAY
ncbi:MAG: sugar transferase [Pseudomonadales bacterium]|nr:sugar transferase [Pseudomonadales bacterium]